MGAGDHHAAALIAAGVAARASWHMRGIERDRDRQRLREAEHEQADRVAASWAYLRWTQASPATQSPWGWRVVVRNNSELPVYGVEVDFLAPDGSKTATSLRTPYATFCGLGTCGGRELPRRQVRRP